jgi:hypothetical protein
MGEGYEMSEQVTRTCDFKIRDGRRYRACGERIPDDEQTVFSIGEAAYKGDLCATHRLQLQEALAPFIAVSQGFTQVGKAMRRLMQTGNLQVTQADMRIWALENTDFEIAPTGALKKEVIEAFNKAHA